MTDVTIPRPGLRLRRKVRWENFPQNLETDVDRYYDVWNYDEGTPVDWKIGLGNLLYIVDEAIKNGRNVRAGGATWSMSPIAMSNADYVNTRPLNLAWAPMARTDLVSGRSPGTFVHAQAGLQVIELHNILRSYGRSLPTAGANAGQTVWGALCTCTHGSGLTRGPIADYVRAAMVVTKGDRPVWVEGHSLPIASDAFLRSFGLDPDRDVIRDDSVLNALIVSFGALGIVHSVVIETDPLFTLEMYRKRTNLDDNLRHAIRTLDFSKLTLPHPGERPYHFEVVINPYANASGSHDAFVTCCYKEPYATTPVQPGAPASWGMGPDLSSIIAGLAKVLPPAVPATMGALLAANYPEIPGKRGTLGELFGNPGPDYRTYSCEIGVPLDQAENAVNTIIDQVKAAIAGQYYYPGLIALRYVQKSQATLAFTRFDTTCTIELPSLGGVASTRGFYEKVWNALAANKIPFALHWGQINRADPQAVTDMFGAAQIRSWQDARAKLLPTGGQRAAFQSAFTMSCGLT